jgi:hypothetical protein
MNTNNSLGIENGNPYIATNLLESMDIWAHIHKGRRVLSNWRNTLVVAFLATEGVFEKNIFKVLR